MMMEEENQRIPLAQRLPRTTYEPECLVKLAVKEITRPVDLVLHSDMRAVERAEFDQQVAEKMSLIEQQREEREGQRKLAEEEEIRRLRKELIPRAQPMPSSGTFGGSGWKKKQLKATYQKPFKLRTEQRGRYKEEGFVKKLQQMMMEEEKKRIPIAQGLPWTTYEPEVAEKMSLIEQHREERERQRKLAEEEEIRRLRKELIPRAQPMLSSGTFGGSGWKKKQLKATYQKPFKLRTEQRGRYKEEGFVKKLQQMMMEEEKQRIPIAQGLPWTTYEPECLVKPVVKEITRPVDLVLHSDVRAVERAEFDQQVAEKMSLIEQHREERQRLQKLAEEEEIKRLRKELIPRGQLMPYFDRPFIPRRSMKHCTIPREPKFHKPPQHKKIKCGMCWNDMFTHQQ